MAKENALQPIKEKTVEFYNDQLTAVLLEEDGETAVYVHLRPLVENLGLNWSAQRQRINRNEILAKYTRVVVVTHTTPQGGAATMTAMDLDYLPGFLFGINASRVKPELKDRLLLYQERCHKVLADAFKSGQLTADPAIDELMADQTNPAVQAYLMTKAINELAYNHLLLEAKASQTEARVTGIEERLETVEAKLATPEQFITEAQASQLSNAVKAVAFVLSKQGEGRNFYGQVYGELYRRYEITTYKRLASKDFEAAISWLNEWYQTLTNEDLPF